MLVILIHQKDPGLKRLMRHSSGPVFMRPGDRQHTRCTLLRSTIFHFSRSMKWVPSFRRKCRENLNTLWDDSDNVFQISSLLKP